MTLKTGGQTVLVEAEERSIVQKLLTCSEWGYPLDTFDLRLVIQQYLNRAGRVVSRFKDNLPELGGIPASNVINYDETNLCDDHGRKKIIAKRGCKYPERIMNHSKSSTSIMFAASGSGEPTKRRICTTLRLLEVHLVPDKSDKKFSTHDSNTDMHPMLDLEEAFDRRYDAAEEVISLLTFNGPRTSNNSPQVSVSNSVLTVTKDDVNIGDWLLVHLPYFINDKAQSSRPLADII
ncbi:hypothetical protein JTB14_016994 [Gonioctena quinquepunctata]|nr:hypothetical protein JTB14_016994 [Gonioctena quinquepunctata]